jgi:AcrR family transcriptional regulator
VNVMHSQGGLPSAITELWVGRPPRRGPRPRLSVADVAQAAVEVADEDGLAALSLQSVAGRLGLATTGLYRYVDSKRTLVEIAVDHATGPAPELPAGDWAAAAAHWCRELLEVHRAHPWLSDVEPSGMPRTPNPLAWLDRLLGALAEAPGAGDPMSAALLLEAVVGRYAALLRSVLPAESGGAADVLAHLEGARAGEFPFLVRAVDRDWSDVEREFDFAVATVLRGLAPG